MVVRLDVKEPAIVGERGVTMENGGLMGFIIWKPIFEEAGDISRDRRLW